MLDIIHSFQVKIWFQNRRMKWKRSKKSPHEVQEKNTSSQSSPINKKDLRNSTPAGSDRVVALDLTNHEPRNDYDTDMTSHEDYSVDFLSNVHDLSDNQNEVSPELVDVDVES